MPAYSAAATDGLVVVFHWLPRQIAALLLPGATLAWSFPPALLLSFHFTGIFLTYLRFSPPLLRLTREKPIHSLPSSGRISHARRRFAAAATVIV